VVYTGGRSSGTSPVVAADCWGGDRQQHAGEVAGGRSSGTSPVIACWCSTSAAPFSSSLALTNGGRRWSGDTEFFRPAHERRRGRTDALLFFLFSSTQTHTWRYTRTHAALPRGALLPAGHTPRSRRDYISGSSLHTLICGDYTGDSLIC
jgi:hypothetical protein